MLRIISILFMFIFSCTHQENSTFDDTAVLQQLISNAGDKLNMALDTDSSGTIEPLELGDQEWKHGRLTYLNIFNVGLQGELPSEIGSLTELTHLGLHTNNLAGELPAEIGNLTQLKQLSLGHNNFNGTLPEEIFKLKNLNILNLGNNAFTGTLSDDFNKLVNLHTIILDSNQFEGTIPESFCKHSAQFLQVQVEGNAFCPFYPSCLASPEALGMQSCNDCGPGFQPLNGNCYWEEDISALQSMIDFSDSINLNMDADSSGSITSLELGLQQWQNSRLTELDCYWEADSCGLSGSLSEEIQNLTHLTKLDLSNNQFTGFIPDSICALTENLAELNLTGNQFCECFPSCLTTMEIGVQDDSNCSQCEEGFEKVCNIPESAVVSPEETECFFSQHLEVLNAIIDSSLFALPDSLDWEMDADSSNSIEALEVGGQYWNNGYLTYLNANQSGLSGVLPNNLSELDSLMTLNIANNFLTGEIPLSICTMINLQFKGEITGATDSYLFNNRFCPPYPSCLLEVIGTQDSTGCE